MPDTIEITRPGRAPLVLVAPLEASLRTLWDLANAKFEARAGHPVTTPADAHLFMTSYTELLTKERGSLSSILRERCEKAPDHD